MFYPLNRVIEYIAYRTTKRHNIIKIRTLRPNYYDKDTLLLHSVMQLVVDYVEIELAALMSSYKNIERFRFLPWYIRPDFRSRELGLEYIELCMSDKNQGEEFYEKIKEVYLWWKDIYPNRKSVEDASGFTKFMQNKKNYSKTYSHKKEKRIFDIIIKLELEYHSEETRMIKTVVDYRNYLWT